MNNRALYEQLETQYVELQADNAALRARVGKLEGDREAGMRELMGGVRE